MADEKWLEEIYTNVVVTPQGTYFIAPLEDEVPTIEVAPVSAEVDLSGDDHAAQGSNG